VTARDYFQRVIIADLGSALVHWVGNCGLYFSEIRTTVDRKSAAFIKSSRKTLTAVWWPRRVWMKRCLHIMTT